MNIRQWLISGAWLLSLYMCGGIAAASLHATVVRVAKLEIDPTQLESYKAALKEEIETSLRVEPGVLGLYAVAEKDNPARIMILEMYADTDAYKAHLEASHFKKYKAATKEMVRSLTLLETEPIILGTKPK